MIDTRAAYRAAGSELSEERLREMMLELLDSTWPTYMVKELADVCDIKLQVCSSQEPDAL